MTWHDIYLDTLEVAASISCRHGAPSLFAFQQDTLTINKNSHQDQAASSRLPCYHVITEDLFGNMMTHMLDIFFFLFSGSHREIADTDTDTRYIFVEQTGG